MVPGSILVGALRKVFDKILKKEETQNWSEKVVQSGETLFRPSFFIHDSDFRRCLWYTMGKIMREISLETPLYDILGARTPLLKRFEKIGIKTVRDLLWHFPSRYEDFSKMSSIADLKPGELATIQATVEDIKLRRTRRGTHHRRSDPCGRIPARSAPPGSTNPISPKRSTPAASRTSPAKFRFPKNTKSISIIPHMRSCGQTPRPSTPDGSSRLSRNQRPHVARHPVRGPHAP